MNASGSVRAVAIVMGIAVAITACDATSPTPTDTSSQSTAASPVATAAAIPPASAPSATRPVGVPANAQPFLFGCTDGLARCVDIAPGTYYTAGDWALLPGLTFTLPAGWTSLANEAGELELYPIAGGGASDMLIWRDVVPWIDGRAAIEQRADPEAWIARLSNDPRLEASEPEQVLLGRRMDARLPAIAITVRISQAAANEMADCSGVVCIELLSDASHWEHPFSIGLYQVEEGFSCPCTNLVRLYFASIGYPSHPHLFVVALQAFGPTPDRDADMARLQAVAQPILDSLIVPTIIVDN
jgi:hypothetical protein